MPRKPTANKRLALTLAIIVPVMVGLSYAAVPLYNLFCRVTGFGGTTLVAETTHGPILDRTVTIRFDANLAPDMPWKFRPKQHSMKVRYGESALAFFEAYNPTDQVVAGQASYNITPYAAGGYFNKIQCFCFTMQVLGPHERVDMPVTFFVDAEMVDDDEAAHVDTITLSYTMNRAEVPDEEEDVSATEPAVAAPADVRSAAGEAQTIAQ